MQILLRQVNKRPDFYFCQGRLINDHIFTLHLILEKCSEHGIDTHHLFIDFRLAYNSIDMEYLYSGMVELKIQEKLITLVKATMKNTQCKVKIQNRLFDPVHMREGLSLIHI